ncbi:MAG: metal ABC transporter permease, partial [Cyanobacteria bacterium J06626_14]
MDMMMANIPVWDWLIEPLQFGFLVKALWVSAFVGVVCAVLSCYITLKGWSLMGDAVSHAVVPGVVVAYAIGIPFAIGAFLFGFGATVAIGYVKSQTRLKEDAVI